MNIPTNAAYGLADWLLDLERRERDLQRMDALEPERAPPDWVSTVTAWNMKRCGRMN